MKMMKRMGLALMLATTVVGASYSAETTPALTNRLDTLRATCASAADKIATDTQKQKDAALSQYGKTLDAILKELKLKGDIDGYGIVETESKRFQSEKTVLTNAPHVYVANAVSAYVKQVQTIEMDAESRRADLLRQYIAALGRLVKDLMAQDKMDEAKAAGDVKKNAEFALAVTEEKLPKAGNVKVPSASVSSVSAEPKSESKDSGWKDITGDCDGGTRRGGVVVLVKQDRMQSKTAYASPIEIEYVCMTDSADIRLAYACNQMIFNFRSVQGELRVDGGPANRQYRPGSGIVPVNKFVTFRQVVLPDKMAIYVDGNLRATWEADFSKVNSPIGVFPCLGSEVTVKSIRVRIPQGLPSESSSPKTVAPPSTTPVSENGRTIENSPKRVFFSGLDVWESPSCAGIAMEIRTIDKTVIPRLAFKIVYLCKNSNTYKVVAMENLHPLKHGTTGDLWWVYVPTTFAKYIEAGKTPFNKMPANVYVEVSLDDQVLHTNLWHKQSGPKDWWVLDEETGKYKGDSDSAVASSSTPRQTFTPAPATTGETRQQTVENKAQSEIEKGTDGTVKYLNHRYKFIAQPRVSYAESVAECEKLGGHLATMTSRSEWAWAKKTFLDGSPDNRFRTIYLGVELPDKRWWTDAEVKWIDGEKFNVKNADWAEGHPWNHKDANGYRFRWIINFGGHWATVGSKDDRVNGYICEWDQ